MGRARFTVHGSRLAQYRKPFRRSPVAGLQIADGDPDLIDLAVRQVMFKRRGERHGLGIFRRAIEEAHAQFAPLLLGVISAAA